jgi:hypothetical protein
MSRHFSPFTREDEKELFKNGLSPDFLDVFRSFYSNSSTESCSVDVVIDLNHATVDEIESWEAKEIYTRVGASFDTYTTTLKLPDNYTQARVSVRRRRVVCARLREVFSRLSFGSYHFIAVI